MTLRSSFVVRALGALALSFAVVAPAVALEPGAVAPGFQLPGQPGEIKLANLRGKVVWVDVWASWCGPCRQSFPWLNQMQQKYGARGLKVIGVNVDQKRDDADRFLSKTPAQFDIAFDEKGVVPATYGAPTMPTSFLIGPDGRVLMVHKGFNSADTDELEGEITRALAKVK